MLLRIFPKLKFQERWPLQFAHTVITRNADFSGSKSNSRIGSTFRSELLYLVCHLADCSICSEEELHSLIILCFRTSDGGGRKHNRELRSTRGLPTADGSPHAQPMGSWMKICGIDE